MKATENKYPCPLLLLLAFTAYIGVGFSQTSKGDHYFRLNMFDAAIGYYKKDVRSKNKAVSLHAMQRLADSYRITGDFSKAEETYKKLMSRKKSDPETYLNYGLALKNSAKYSEAIPMFQEYLRLKPDDKMGKVHLLSCDSAQKWLDESLGKEVKNLRYINTAATEMSPFVYKEQLVFSSSREGSTKPFISLNGGGDISRLDLFRVPLARIEARDRAVKGFAEINTALHEGPSCLSPDGRELYFTRTVKGKRNLETNEVVATLQVFYSRLDSTGEWSKPQSAFSFNSLDYSTGHPALSADGNTIFFMSDKAGGYGKTDIYYSKRQADGSWGAPVNAGSRVNTFGHELFPSCSAEGNLYFSSDGHPGMGQLDIFKASLVNEKWGLVSNLKPPVNSISNDFGISFYKNSQRGFFSSDRFNGKGQEDLYCFTEEVPMEVAVINDTLVIPDFTLFDDVKYQLMNESESKRVEFTKTDGKLKAPLKKDNIYILESERYGLVYNHVFIRYSVNPAEKAANYKFATSHRKLRISGKCYIGLEKKGPNARKPPKKSCSVLGNIAFGELEMRVDKQGNYYFDAVMDPGKESIICSKDIVRYEGE